MRTLITVADLAEYRQALATQKTKIGFVPTMGALHAGHISLVKKAKESCDAVIASIFVNPAQFGPKEDFSRYPRTLAEDAALLEQAGTDAVFTPIAAEVYPPGFQTYVRNQVMANDLCGLSRPNHFEGVLTIVLKLLNWVQPDIAVFGKKDYQQWRLIEAMAKDFYLPVKIVGGEIVREADGLAMSSRNRYLSAKERETAANIFRGLTAAKEDFIKGERASAKILERLRAVISETPDIQVEYAEVRAQETLKPISEIKEPAVVLVAGKLGNTRLIDNIELSQ